ncbi:hypothetical protein TCE0_011r00558 [Talaromyces pinophilus]|uniref:RCC1-like domain-containing protein n=1 Tax=Talaromyces pinophilus TaxID=128442 RepID=A0A0B8MXK0_TALPI|nr:hypothetical protein TCE0_011r00558 [Talaromyces pinophilus]
MFRGNIHGLLTTLGRLAGRVVSTQGDNVYFVFCSIPCHTIVPPKRFLVTKVDKEGGDEDDENDDEVDLNLKEAAPLPVASSHFPDGTVFTQLVATDSATFALASNGLGYGWGTFRDNNGSTLFSLQSKIQRVPTLIPDVKDIIKLVAGAQHVLALTSNGAVFSWGNNEQNQLGRRMINRHHDHPWLVPAQCSLPRGITDVSAGIYHSFAIHKSGQLYAWGSNNFGQTGIFQSAGQSDAVILYPTPVPSLGKGSGIVSVTGGKDHSLALNNKGQCLTWGRIDNKALGIVAKDIPTHDVIVDTYGKPRILKVPTPISGVDGKVVFTAAGTDHSFAITQDGKPYSWGFNAHIRLDTGMRK